MDPVEQERVRKKWADRINRSWNKVSYADQRRFIAWAEEQETPDSDDDADDDWKAS